MKKYEVWIENPVSYNQAYRTFRGRVLLSEEGREFAGEWVMVPKTKPVTLKEGQRIVNEKIIKSGKNKGRTKVFIEGRCGKVFREAGIEPYAEGVKVQIKAWAVWPNKLNRDMSNFQKLIEDCFQHGKFIPNDSHILYQNKNFRYEPGVFGLKLEISELVEEE